MATVTNEDRERDTVQAALAANPRDPEPKAYKSLMAPYPVWAAMFACGMIRKDNKHKNVATGLFQDAFETCINLNEKAIPTIPM